jgi:hypothetical protein
MKKAVLLMDGMDGSAGIHDRSQALAQGIIAAQAGGRYPGEPANRRGEKALRFSMRLPSLN